MTNHETTTADISTFPDCGQDVNCKINRALFIKYNVKIAIVPIWVILFSTIIKGLYKDVWSFLQKDQTDSICVCVFANQIWFNLSQSSFTFTTSNSNLLHASRYNGIIYEHSPYLFESLKSILKFKVASIWTIKAKSTSECLGSFLNGSIFINLGRLFAYHRT